MRREANRWQTVHKSKTVRGVSPGLKDDEQGSKAQISFRRNSLDGFTLDRSEVTLGPHPRLSLAPSGEDAG